MVNNKYTYKSQSRKIENIKLLQMGVIICNTGSLTKLTLYEKPVFQKL